MTRYTPKSITFTTTQFTNVLVVKEQHTPKQKSACDDWVVNECLEGTAESGEELINPWLSFLRAVACGGLVVIVVVVVRVK